MHALVAVALATSFLETDPPRTFLASIDLQFGSHQSVSGFKFDTWGVQFYAVCHIPSGWFIEAGTDATLKGVLKGEGSHGATWLNKETLGDLRGLVLVTMWGPVQRDDVRYSDGTVSIPATFKGYAVIGDSEKRAPLNFQNVKLTPATGCPSLSKRPASR